MKARRHPWPAVPRCFDSGFTTLLHALLQRASRPLGERGEPQRAQRARRAALSQSGTFVGHRPYVRGDDLRRLDWAAYARSGELFLKQLEEDERRTVALLLDLSPRLCVGTPPRRLFAMRLAAVIGGLALQRLDGLTVIAPGHEVPFSTFAGAADLESLLRFLDGLPYAAATADLVPRLLLQRAAPGRVHWVSDFAEPQRVERPLFALRRRGIRVIGWLPTMAEDRQAPQRGHLRLVDPHTDEELVVPVDAAVAAELLHQMTLLRRQQDHLFAQTGSVLRRWSVPSVDDVRLEPYRPILDGCRR